MYAPLPPAFQMTGLNGTPGPRYQPVSPQPFSNYSPYKEQPAGLNGPVQQRQCTDICWAILYLLSFLTFFALIGYGYYLGKPAPLLGFYDSTGVKCSSSSYPYAYMPNLQSGSSSVSCVQLCPNKGDTVTKLGGGTFTATYSSSLIAGTYCAPTTKMSGGTQFNTALYLNQVFSDISNSAYLIASSVGGSILLSLGLILLFRCCPRFIVWTCCIVVFLTLVGIATYAYLYSIGISYFALPVNLSAISVQALQISAYVLWALAGLFVIFLLCAYKRIRLSLGIIDTTSLYISETCHITMFTPFASILFLGLLTALVSGMFYLYCIGDIQPNPIGQPFASATNQSLIATIFFWVVLGLGIWNLFFINGFTSFILSSSAAIWYFSNSSVQLKPHRPFCVSLWRAFRFHIGSIAFGSLILGIFFPLRLIGAIFQRNYAQPSNCLVGCFYSMCDCCVGCFSCFLQFMSKGCYTQMAVKGSNYCSSTMEAFRLIATSPIRIAINSALTSILLLICKLTISGLVGAGVFYCILSFNYFYLIVSSPMIPVALCMLIAFGVSSIILSIFGTSANVIIQCFIIDQLDGMSLGQRARYCPAPLRHVIDNNTYAD